jgi:type IV pilus assembly protein PilE
MRSFHPKAKHPIRMSGFTLIELLIAVAIVGILASIALPSYFRFVASARRTDASAQVLQVAQFMQRFYAANDSYKTDRSGNAVMTQVPVNLLQSPRDATDSPLYRLAIPDASLDNMKFTLQMVPVAGSVMSKDKCGTLTIDSTGLRGVIVNGTPGGTVLRDTCWR